MLFSSISLQQDLRTEQSYEIPSPAAPRTFSISPRTPRLSFSKKMQPAPDSPAIDNSPCTPASRIATTDPIAAWEVRRAAWLKPRSSAIPDGGKRKRLKEIISNAAGSEASTANRLRTLEVLLEDSISLSLGSRVVENASEESSGVVGRAMERAGSCQASGSASPVATTESKGKKVATILRKASHAILRIDDEPIPDDGLTVRQSDKARGVNVDRASEAILAAFRQGRLLKDALPLGLVTKLLYRSWTIDGTIPMNYDPSISLSAYSPFNTTTLHDATTTMILPSRARTTSAATPPLDSTIQRNEILLGVGIEGTSTREGGTKPIPTKPNPSQGSKPIAIKSNPLQGSKWRVEKDVDSSCSDVI